MAATGFARERQFTWRAFFVCLVISLSVLAFGYPTAIIGTTLSQPSFLQYMNLVDDNGIPRAEMENLIGALSGVYQVNFNAGCCLPRLQNPGWRRHRDHLGHLDHG